MYNPFPLKLWDRLIPQTDTQVNILWQAKLTPKVSAYAYLKKPHDCNHIPMAPLRCAIRTKKKPTTGHGGNPTSSVGSTWERPLNAITATM